MPPISTLLEKKPNYFHKILGLSIKQNAMVEINNLISENRNNIVGISTKDISEITCRYKVNWERKFQKQKLKIYHKFLTHYVKKEQPNEKTIEDLVHLSNLLSIQKGDCRKEMENVCAESYFRKVKRLMKDHQIDMHEQNNLEFLKNRLFG